MKHLCLTDWVTLRANSSSVITITQGEEAWLDVGDYEDAIFYLDVREVTAANTVNLYYQTSPSKEDASFVNIYSIALTPTATTQTTQRVLAKYSAVPIARYVRWQIAGLAGTGTFDATLRIHVAVT